MRDVSDDDDPDDRAVDGIVVVEEVDRLFSSCDRISGI